MSIKITSLVWELKLPPEQKLVLLAMADFADNTGKRCYPGKKRLSRMTGKSVRVIQRILHTLKEKKLAIPTGYDKGGRGMATEYHLHPENGERAETETRATLLSDEKGRRAERER